LSSLSYFFKTSQHHGKKCILLGDSAHGQLPFYGQGMNTGFEDLVYFFDLLDQKGFEHLSEVLSEYSKLRVPDAHAICELSEYNYKEVLMKKALFILFAFFFED
jgi:kynurenine 3-monooxygenase